MSQTLAYKQIPRCQTTASFCYGAMRFDSESCTYVGQHNPYLSMSCSVLMTHSSFDRNAQSNPFSEPHLCFVQKYVEQISQLANMCQPDAKGVAAADLETLVSMRVSSTCSFCTVQLTAERAPAIAARRSPVYERRPSMFEGICLSALHHLCWQSFCIGRAGWSWRLLAASA